LPCFSYSSLLHLKEKLDNNVLYNLVNLYVTLLFIPLAILFESQLFGWISIICLYTTLGFSFICGGLCYFIGFHDKEAMIRVSITSTILLSLFVTLKLLHIGDWILKPFSTPVMAL
jgi:hypothetical protein